MTYFSSLTVLGMSRERRLFKEIAVVVLKSLKKLQLLRNSEKLPHFSSVTVNHVSHHKVPSALTFWGIYSTRTRLPAS